MSDNRRLIRIENNLIWLTPTHHLRLAQTNLPTSLKFRQAEIIYWEIALDNYRKTEEKICMEVTDYYPIHTSKFEQQSLRAPLKKIEFVALKWEYLEPFLGAYKKEDLQELIIDSEHIIAPDQSKSKLEFQIRVPLKEISYHLGYVSARIYHDRFDSEIEIQILNDNIIPEFQFIKSYFAKKFRKKTIVVDINMEWVGNRIKSVVAKSEDIAKIDKTYVDTIKYNRTMGLVRKPLVVPIDKSLFTADQVFDAFSETKTANVFDQSGRDIIKLLSDHGMVRNRKQLQYLSGLKQAESFRIHISLKPVMGFLFLLEGDQMFHFCWELINSHATYIWSFSKGDHSISRAFKQVEQKVQMIRDHGRDRYKQAYRRGDLKDDLVFNLIIHRDAGSMVKDTFPNWRQQLEEKLL